MRTSDVPQLVVRSTVDLATWPVRSLLDAIGVRRSHYFQSDSYLFGAVINAFSAVLGLVAGVEGRRSNPFNSIWTPLLIGIYAPIAIRALCSIGDPLSNSFQDHFPLTSSYVRERAPSWTFNKYQKRAAKGSLGDQAFLAQYFAGIAANQFGNPIAKDVLKAFEQAGSEMSSTKKTDQPRLIPDNEKMFVKEYAMGAELNKDIHQTYLNMENASKERIEAAVMGLMTLYVSHLGSPRIKDPRGKAALEAIHNHTTKAEIHKAMQLAQAEGIDRSMLSIQDRSTGEIAVCAKN